MTDTQSHTQAELTYLAYSLTCEPLRAVPAWHSDTNWPSDCSQLLSIPNLHLYLPIFSLSALTLLPSISLMPRTHHCDFTFSRVLPSVICFQQRTNQSLARVAIPID